MATPVIFRRFTNGRDIIAIFPTVPATQNIAHCQSYQHVGQHGACDPVGLIKDTEPCKYVHEYSDLLRELIGIGYDDLEIKQRITYRHFKARQESLKGGSK